MDENSNGVAPEETIPADETIADTETGATDAPPANDGTVE